MVAPGSRLDRQLFAMGVPPEFERPNGLGGDLVDEFEL